MLFPDLPINGTRMQMAAEFRYTSTHADTRRVDSARRLRLRSSKCKVGGDNVQHRHKRFQRWFTPARKRWAGASLIVIALVGMAMNPASRWPWVLATGVIWLIATWLPRR